MSRRKLHPQGRNRNTLTARAALNSLGFLVLLSVVWGILWENDEESILEAPWQEETLKTTTVKLFPEKTSESQPEPVVDPAATQDQPGDLGEDKTLRQDLLILRTSSRTWAEIYSADGERLLFGMLTSEKSPVRVRGRAPLRILLGHSPDVTLELNGRNIDPSRFNRPNNTAHFLVDDTGAHRIPVSSSDR